MKKLLSLCTIIAIIILLSFTSSNAATPSSLKVTFIDVGQGDSELIQTPTGENKF